MNPNTKQDIETWATSIILMARAVFEADRPSQLYDAFNDLEHDFEKLRTLVDSVEDITPEGE